MTILLEGVFVLAYRVTVSRIPHVVDILEWLDPGQLLDEIGGQDGF